MNKFHTEQPQTLGTNVTKTNLVARYLYTPGIKVSRPLFVHPWYKSNAGQHLQYNYARSLFKTPMFCGHVSLKCYKTRLTQL